jgi:hypothetical protein
MQRGRYQRFEALFLGIILLGGLGASSCVPEATSLPPPQSKVAAYLDLAQQAQRVPVAPMAGVKEGTHATR